MAQPQWELIANLGDASADYGNLDYGAYYVYSDVTGVYPPEAELIEEPADADSHWTSDGWASSARWCVYRFSLDRCTYIGGVLADNRYHPEHPAWFADSLANMAAAMDVTVEAIIGWLCSENPLERAEGYRAIGEYHGYENLDSYPLILTPDDVTERYAGVRIGRGAR